ncbi:hypothetical protein SAMN02746069_01996 [Legionella israelensis DSM 19235]|nr:hypothetical protein SAMN02746069_01996 [Legionella israelensis DSM 19235]
MPRSFVELFFSKVIFYIESPLLDSEAQTELRVDTAVIREVVFSQSSTMFTVQQQDLCPIEIKSHDICKRWFI